MKLPDFFQFEPLNRLRSRMGIADDHYGSFSLEIAPSSRLTRAELERLSNEGIDVDFSDITILPDGTLAYKDSRVLLYIRDIRVYGQHDNEPRYHLFNCTKLKEMFQIGRFERYVVAAKPNGEFEVKTIRASGVTSVEHRRLRVCRFCLDSLELKGYRSRMRQNEKERIVAEFTPDDFFRIYPRSLHTVTSKFDSDTAPLNDYVPDFPAISERLRREKGWRCEKCGLTLSPHDRRQYLDVHHINGVRSDNTPQNLKVLCIVCHAKEPHHSHMRSTPRYAKFVKNKYS